MMLNFSIYRLAATRRGALSPDATDSVLLSVFTLVVWTTWLAVGITGLIVPPRRSTFRMKVPPEIPTVLINADLIAPDDPSPTLDAPSPQQDAAPPQEMANIPAAPTLPAVAAPSPAIAFAQPVVGPTQLAPAQLAVPIAPSTTPPQLAVAQTGPPTTAPVKHLVFGQGLGRQPIPEYPREAQIARQQGTITIVFTTGDDTHVISARITSPCPWPLLNQSALRTVRESWREPAGSYEVSITFKSK